MGLSEIVLKDIDSLDLADDKVQKLALLNALMNFQSRVNGGKFLDQLRD
jgi:hypothetical protein